MQERENGAEPRALTALPEDRERDLGFRGTAYSTAAWLMGAVFVVGLAIVAVVVIRSRRSK